MAHKEILRADWNEPLALEELQRFESIHDTI